MQHLLLLMMFMTLMLLVPLQLLAVFVADDGGQGTVAFCDDDVDDVAGDGQKTTPRIVLSPAMVADGTTTTTAKLNELLATCFPKLTLNPQVSATHKTAPGALPYLVFRPQCGFRFSFGMLVFRMHRGMVSGLVLELYRPMLP